VRIQRSVNDILFRAVTLLAVSALKFAWVIPTREECSLFWLKSTVCRIKCQIPSS
jgi:hypothetical protein